MFRSFLIVLFLSTVRGVSSPGQVPGCTDPLATNFNAQATVNDGSCQYLSTIVSPAQTWSLPQVVDETSGLIVFNNQLWTHNDETDINLYAFGFPDFRQYTTYTLAGTQNTDWEDIDQDQDYIYVGDFGNNSRGNRTDLRILRIDKSSLPLNQPVIDTIWFSYSQQTDFANSGSNNTDFDCEAMIVTADSIYLFTKEWVSEQSSLYALSKNPGTYVARFRDRINVNGLITGATHLPGKSLVVLTGYSSALQPFLYLLYDYNDEQIFSGNKRKLMLNMPLHQVEGIATTDGLNYYISNETFTFSLVTKRQAVHRIDLSGYLGHFIAGTSLARLHPGHKNVITYPNPANDMLIIETDDVFSGLPFGVFNIAGQEILNGDLGNGFTIIDTMLVEPGLYFLRIGFPVKFSRKILIK